MWIKICGITRKEELEAALRVRPDALGFVVETEGSKRNHSLQEAEMLIDLVPSSISTVAVTLNQKRLKEIAMIADYVQVYVDSPFPLEARVIRGYLPSEFDLESFESIEDEIDMVLIDSGHGSGITHDWGLTRKIRENVGKPLLLAGGLNPVNVGAAIREVGPFGVDVSSGVEISGKKDFSLMKQFVEKARGA